MEARPRGTEGTRINLMNGIGRTHTGLEGNLGPQPERFEEVFGEGQFPRVFFAPGRVNLMGAHLDYNGGPVMPMGIDRGTWVAARVVEGGDRLALATSRDGVRVHQFLCSELPREPLGSWTDYVVGVVRALLPHREQGIGGLNLDFGGNLPVGAGLSSSASLCLVSAVALNELWGLGLDRRSLVQAALEAEREHVGLPCGIMDPFAVGLAEYGSVLWLNCQEQSYAHLPIDLERFGVAVADSGVRRDLREVGYRTRVEECGAAAALLIQRQQGARSLCDIDWETFRVVQPALSPTQIKRVRHVLRERDRTMIAREALNRGDMVEFGRLMFAAHESLRVDYQVSCPELDQLVSDAFRIEGILGSRLTGAGFGGCTVILHERGAELEIERLLSSSFHDRFGRRPELWFFTGCDGPRELASSR